MDAKEYFESKRGCQEYIFGKSEMIEFADIYHAERSKEEAAVVLGILSGASKVYGGGYSDEKRDAFKHGVETAYNCIEAYFKKGMDSQNAANFASGKEEG